MTWRKCYSFLLLWLRKLIAPVKIKWKYKAFFLNPTNIVLVNGQIWLSSGQAFCKHFTGIPNSIQPWSMLHPTMWWHVGCQKECKTCYHNPPTSLQPYRRYALIWAEEKPIKQYLHKNYQLLLTFSILKKKIFQNKFYRLQHSLKKYSEKYSDRNRFKG